MDLGILRDASTPESERLMKSPLSPLRLDSTSGVNDFSRPHDRFALISSHRCPRHTIQTTHISFCILRHVRTGRTPNLRILQCSPFCTTPGYSPSDPTIPSACRDHWRQNLLVEILYHHLTSFLPYLISGCILADANENLFSSPHRYDPRGLEILTFSVM